MDRSYWQKQGDKPLYPDLLWSRPENRAQAGKLAIIGGNSHSFSVLALSYSAAAKAGAGSIRVLLPDSLRRSLEKVIDDAWFCSSTKSGSFSRESLGELLESSKWSDLTLLAGNFGNNSETAVLIESFLADYKGPLCISGDAIDFFINSPALLLNRPNTFLIAEFSQLQKLFAKASPARALKSSMSLLMLIDTLKEITDTSAIGIVTSHEDQLMCAYKGRVSTSQSKTTEHWQTEVASFISVWWMQNPSSDFEAVTIAIFEYLYGT